MSTEIAPAAPSATRATPDLESTNALPPGPRERLQGSLGEKPPFLGFLVYGRVHQDGPLILALRDGSAQRCLK